MRMAIATDADPTGIVAAGAHPWMATKATAPKTSRDRLIDLLKGRHPMFARPDALPIFVSRDKGKSEDFTGWLSVRLAPGSRRLLLPTRFIDQVTDTLEIPIGGYVLALDRRILDAAGIAEADLRGLGNGRVELRQVEFSVRLTVPVGLVSQDVQKTIFDLSEFEPA